MNVYERVRRAQAKQAAAAAAAEYKAGEHARRSAAARMCAEVRKDTRLDNLANGVAEPRTVAEFQFLERMGLL